MLKIKNRYYSMQEICNTIWEVTPMKKLISCKYNFDNFCVEQKFTDCSVITIDTSSSRMKLPLICISGQSLIILLLSMPTYFER